MFLHIEHIKETKNALVSKSKNTATQMKEVKSDSDHWIKYGDVTLSRKQRQQILNGSELCDMHVNGFQNLVKRLFPHIGGLQNTLLQSKNAITNKAGKPILQIIHIRDCHWATLYVHGDDICLYDSAYMSLSEDTFTVIAQLIRFSGKSFSIKVMNVAKQSGSVDCALYSMATALNLALGNDPTEVVYNQPDLRPHLVKCLELATLSPFPSLKT